MIEKRLERIEVMVADLIRIVGSTNSMVEEVRDKVNVLEERFDGLEKRFDELENKGEVMESKVDALQDDVKIMKAAMATKEDISLLNERFDFQMEKLGRQEEDIYRLKRVAGVR